MLGIVGLWDRRKNAETGEPVTTQYHARAPSDFSATCTFLLWPVAAGARRRFQQRFASTSRDRREFVSVRLALILYLLGAGEVV